MKRILISAVLSLCAAMTFAIPAKKSWKVVSQSDGTTIKVSQAGDEHLHYYITEDNVPIYKAADN